MGNSAGELYLETLRKLTLDNRGLAALLGVGLRTVERYGSKLVVLPGYAHRFARAVHAQDPELAGRLAACAGTNLVALGLVPATGEERRAARGGSVAWAEDAQLVIEAAAHAAGLSLKQAKAALGAAVAAAVDLGLTLEQLEPVLQPKKPSRR